MGTSGEAKSGKLFKRSVGEKTSGGGRCPGRPFTVLSPRPLFPPRCRRMPRPSGPWDESLPCATAPPPRDLKQDERAGVTRREEERTVKERQAFLRDCRGEDRDGKVAALLGGRTAQTVEPSMTQGESLASIEDRKNKGHLP